MLGLLIAPFALLLLIAVLLYIPPVQRFVVAQATKILSERTGMTVHIDHLHLGFPLDLNVGGVEVIKAEGDTLLTLSSLSFSPSLRPLFDKQIEIPEIQLSGLNLNYTDSTGLTQLKAKLAEAAVERLFVDLDKEQVQLGRLLTRGGDVTFASQDTTTQEKKSEPIRWQIAAETVELSETKVRVNMPLDSLYVSADVSVLRG